MVCVDVGGIGSQPRGVDVGLDILRNAERR